MRSEAHLRNIRRLPSCVSAQPGCEAHHLCGGPAALERGVGKKAGDQWAVPLTADEHRDLHTFGSKLEREWFANRGVEDVYALAAALWEWRDDFFALRVIVMRTCMFGIPKP